MGAIKVDCWLLELLELDEEVLALLELDEEVIVLLELDEDVVVLFELDEELDVAGVDDVVPAAVAGDVEVVDDDSVSLPLHPASSAMHATTAALRKLNKSGRSTNITYSGGTAPKDPA